MRSIVWLAALQGVSATVKVAPTQLDGGHDLVLAQSAVSEFDPVYSTTQLAEVDQFSNANGLFGSSSTKKKNESSPIGEFIVGCIMIPFSLVFLWKNEKKLVTYSKVISYAKSIVKTISVENPYDENDLCLVACQGKTVNEQDLNDYAFGVCVKNSYRLYRKVEMF